MSPALVPASPAAHAQEHSLDIIDLRHFASKDLRSLLEEESREWVRQLDWDYHGSAEMILRYVDAKILPGYAAVDHGHVRGYAFFVYEGGKGVIGDLYVHPGSRQGNGDALQSALLTHVIETLQHSPGIHRVEAQLLMHETGAVTRPFLQQGFRGYRRLFMVLPLAQGATPGSAVGSGGNGPDHLTLPPDIELRKWSEADFQGAASVITAAYRGHVDAEINDQYRSVSGSMRFLNNIVRFPGCGVFDGESSFVAISRRTHTVVGIILCSRVKEDVGHVTQVCVLPEHRGRQIGESLMAATTAELRRRHFSSLSLTVTEANHRAVELYKRLGFDVIRVFDAFVWEG
ncbi:MAG TPA: GNAT family N-acetyltransferase [Terriglobales bacterium]|nr:GNAT family N-acetyltransferase [Terriglobales bacterium]